MRRSLLLLLLIILMLPQVGGCGLFRSKKEAPIPTTVPLRITNRNWQDMTIYIVRDGQRNRLGEVTAASSTTFLLTSRHLGQQGRVQLVADPLGSVSGIATEVFAVRMGQRVDWTLESDVRRSSLAVY